jgi:hypothetical protein
MTMPMRVLILIVLACTVTASSKEKREHVRLEIAEVERLLAHQPPRFQEALPLLVNLSKLKPKHRGVRVHLVRPNALRSTTGDMIWQPLHTEYICYFHHRFAPYFNFKANVYSAMGMNNKAEKQLQKLVKMSKKRLEVHSKGVYDI